MSIEELVNQPYPFIIAASVVLIISFIFGELSKRTSIPSVLMLIVLGVVMKLGLDRMGLGNKDFFFILKILGTIGLIMIVLEAALELKLERSKIVPITIALVIALVGLLLSTWITAEVLHKFIFCTNPAEGQPCGVPKLTAWIYATPLSILSSAIIIPSVLDLRKDKKEFHIYESTFSDIFGIMLFYFLTGMVPTGEEAHSGGGVSSFLISIVLTLIIAFVASYALVLIFQKIRSSVKLFLLIATLLLLYSLGKKMHLSSLIIILIFGLVISNMDIFFIGPFKKLLDKKKANEIYHGLHVITMESAFVIRTFFFVIFGITIEFASLADFKVLWVSLICLAIIYIIRFILLRVSIGKDLNPQLYIAPRGLITVLLFYGIPETIINDSFSPGILLYIIIGTSIIMTISMILDKNRSQAAISEVKSMKVGESKWQLPEIK